MKRPRISCTVVLACLGALALAACSKPTDASGAGQGGLSIAAASSMKPALDEIVAAYMRGHPGSRVTVTYGSSGTHYAQLANKGPFDLFYSADTQYPRRLVEEGLAVPESMRVYARGKLVLWSAKESGIDVARGAGALTDPRVRHIAIANPQHSPYGRAAKEAMGAMGLEQAVADKLVLGENVEQAAQFAQSGAAEVALVPLSLAGTAAMASKGAYWTVPAEMYKPIEHGVVVLSYSAHVKEAMAFDSFLAGPKGREILERHGLGGGP